MRTSYALKRTTTTERRSKQPREGQAGYDPGEGSNRPVSKKLRRHRDPS